MKKIVCNFDNKRQHKNCQHINTCELNPTPSRYKKQLEMERMEAIEKEELRNIEYLNELLICDKKQCKLFGNVETCQHGVVHKWTDSCKMECPRYPEARCIPKGG